MKHIKFDDCRSVLQSGNVVNCEKVPQVMQAKQMFEDFTIETLEHQDAPYRGKSGDYIMISQSAEMYVCDKDYFEKNYKVNSFFDINQFAKSSEDYHDSTTIWDDTPFNEYALKILRLKKIQKSSSYQESLQQNATRYPNIQTTPSQQVKEQAEAIAKDYVKKERAVHYDGNFGVPDMELAVIYGYESRLAEADGMKFEIEALKDKLKIAENSLEKIKDRCDAGIFDIVDTSFIGSEATEALNKIKQP